MSIFRKIVKVGALAVGGIVLVGATIATGGAVSVLAGVGIGAIASIGSGVAAGVATGAYSAVVGGCALAECVGLGVLAAKEAEVIADEVKKEIK